MSNGIESVIVLMLENRSWDHMLGFISHPDPRSRASRARKAIRHPSLRTLR